MGETVLFDMLRQALLISVRISAPLLGVALIAGVVIGLFQALTSVQEMTLTFVPKVGLMLGEHAAPAIPMPRIVGQEIQLLGSHGMQAHRYGAMLDMVASGKLDPARLVGDRISLAEAPAALVNMDRFQSVGATIITRF